TILAYSLAQHANLAVEFQDVLIPEYWTQVQGSSLLNGHVNLRVKEKEDEGGVYRKRIFGKSEYVIDFDLETNKSHFPVRVLQREDVVAMFYTNKSAQALLDHQYDLAYAYLRAALQY